MTSQDVGSIQIAESYHYHGFGDLLKLYRVPALPPWSRDITSPRATMGITNHFKTFKRYPTIWNTVVLIKILLDN